MINCKLKRNRNKASCRVRIKKKGKWYPINKPFSKSKIHPKKQAKERAWTLNHQGFGQAFGVKYKAVKNPRGRGWLVMSSG